jgi:hypothetical protein
LRHGLSLPVANSPELDHRARKLAKALVGASTDPIRFEQAMRIAEAQIDLLRIRQTRLALYGDAQRRGLFAPSHAGVESVPFEASLEVQAAGLGEGLGALGRELTRLDRYERRALSRRKFAIRDFDLF